MQTGSTELTNRISIAFTCWVTTNAIRSTTRRIAVLICEAICRREIEGQGDNKSFTIRMQEQEGGEVKEVRYSVYKDARGVLKVNAPNIGTGGRRRR